ncbi:MAG: hypothetical protein ACLP0J_26065 [Solirubrobacteraceae bacterium]
MLAYARQWIDLGRADDVVSEAFVVAWRLLDDVRLVPRELGERIASS